MTRGGGGRNLEDATGSELSFAEPSRSLRLGRCDGVRSSGLPRVAPGGAHLAHFAVAVGGGVHGSIYLSMIWWGQG